MSTSGISFREEYDVAAIRKRGAELAKLHNVGQSIGDLMYAVTSGMLNLSHSNPHPITKDTKSLSIQMLMIHAATELDQAKPELAEELRRRATLLADVL